MLTARTNAFLVTLLLVVALDNAAIAQAGLGEGFIYQDELEYDDGTCVDCR